MNKQYWLKELDSWTYPLKDVLRSPYMDKLMNFVSLQYATQEIIPSKKSLFRYFRMCQWQEVHVVVLVPSEATLVAYGNVIYNGKVHDYAEGPLISIIREVERRCYNGLKLNFDYTLEDWGRQGILVLPLSLTYDKATGVAHKLQWNKFIQYVIQQLNDYRQGTIFLEWGTDLRLFKHWEFKAENPEVAFQKGYDWKFDFPEVNKKLKELNNIEIEW
jgi:uracil DNA glycosylase